MDDISFPTMAAEFIACQEATPQSSDMRRFLEALVYWTNTAYRQGRRNRGA